VLASGAGTTAILVLDDPLTDGATYEVTVSSVEDTSGNALDVDHDTVSFTPTICRPPIERDASLWKRIPLINREMDAAGTGELRKLIACLEVVYRELLCDIDHWTEILDPDLAPEAVVDAMLADLGNPFEQFVLDLTDKRRLAKLLTTLFGIKGTDPGIIDAINLLVGVVVTISVPAFDGVWKLGVSELGDTTVLGTNVKKDIYSFDINAPVALTEAQRQAIRWIAAYIRRAPTHLRRINEPEAPPIVPDDWELGLSELGVGTLLH
jgi:phage tail-like protein